MNWIIAESGGTKTDWRISIDGKIIQRQAKSLHPSQLSDDLLKEEKAFWSKFNLSEFSLDFFGAGTLKEEGKEKVMAFLSNIGFLHITVKSDLHAAGIASLNNKTGWIAILGTGSVLFHWDGNNPIEIIGGKGHLEGDEGSGYYFGKLVLEADHKNQLSIAQRKEVSKIDPIPQLKQKLETAELSKKLSKNFKEFHLKNLQLFSDRHLNNSIEKLHIIGSYGFNNQQLIQSIFSCEVVEFIQYPIDRILTSKQ